MEMSDLSAYRRPAELLRQRACPRDVAARGNIEQRAQEAAKTEAVMGKKVAVFPREQGVNEMLRDLVYGDQLPVLVSEELRDLPVMDVEDPVGSAGLWSPNCSFIEMFLVAASARPRDTPMSSATANATINNISKRDLFRSI